MSQVVCNFIPHKRQLEIMQDPHRYKVISAGRRFGKSIMSINFLIYKALREPGNYWFISPTLTQSKMIIWEQLKKYAPKEAISKQNENELWIKFITGGSIRVLGADNEQALRGVGLKGCVLDEYATMKKHVWESILRPMLLEAKGWAIFISTPAGYNHFYELFIKDPNFNNREYRNMDGQFIDPDPDYKSWEFKSIDSPFIDPEEVEKARKESSEEYYLQEYEAKFCNHTGIVFKEFRDSHVKNFEFDRRWNIFVGLDTGKFTGITFIGLDYNNKAWVFDEIYNIDGIVEDIVKLIKEKLKKYGLQISDVQFIIDSASQVKREFMAQGIITIDSEKDTLNNIDTLRARFKNDKIEIHPDCIVTISQIKSYSWQEKLMGKSKLPAPKRENDHILDGILYCLGSKFVVHAKEYKKQHTLKSFKESKIDILSKEFEQIEDELNIAWSGNNPYINDKNDNSGDSVTGY